MVGAIIALVYDEARRIWCYRWLAALTTILLFCAAAAFIWTRPSVYDAWGQIYVSKQTPVVTAAQGVSLVGDSYGGASVVGKTLLNDHSLERIIRKMNPAAAGLTKAEMEGAVAYLKSKIELRSDDEGFFEFHVKDADPVYAHKVVQLLLNEFVSRNVSRNEQELHQAGTFLDTQIASYDSMIAASKSRIVDFQRRNPRFVAAMRSFEVGGGGGLGGGIELAEARATYNAMLAQQGGGGAGSARVADLQEKLAALRTQYTELHPDVIAMNRQLAEARRVQRARPSGDPALAAARQRLLAAQRAAAGSAAIATLPPELQAEWSDLQKNDEVLRLNYQQLIAKREGARVSQAVYGGDGSGKYQITRQPTVPELPMGPPRSLYLGLALAGAIVAGVGAAYLRAAMVGIFVSPRELEHIFQLPVVGTVSWEPAWSTAEAANPGTLASVRATLLRSWRRSQADTGSTSVRVS